MSLDSTSGPYIQARPGLGGKVEIVRGSDGRPGVETPAAVCPRLDIAQAPLTLSFVAGALLLGCLFHIFGHRLGRISLFLVGLVFGGVVIYLVCDKEQLLPFWGTIGVAVGAGFLFGLITGVVEYVGLFVLGFVWGILLGTLGLVALASFSPIASLWTTLGVLFLTGVVGSLVSLRWERLFVILGTALIGGCLIAAGLDALLQEFRLVRWIWAILNLEQPPFQHCWNEWAVLGAAPALAAISILLQYLVTSSPSPGSKETRRREKRRRGGKEECQRLAAPHRTVPAAKSPASVPKSPPKSFRQLYQLRRAHGDVICQSYMESLRRPQSTIDSAGNQSHLTVILDD